MHTTHHTNNCLGYEKDVILVKNFVRDDSQSTTTIKKQANTHTHVRLKKSSKKCSMIKVVTSMNLQVMGLVIWGGNL
jgi:CTP:phosphocholine cytidylyltransferase-like protein